MADTGNYRVDKWQIWSGPDTTITYGPSGPINSASASFVFSSNEEGSSFECSLDVIEFTPCSSPKLYEGLSQGTHVFRVRAVNAAGYQDPTAASREFGVDAEPPETTITEGPSGLVNTSSASFSFTASEESTFECKRDSGSWQSCTSPKSYSSLSDSSHSFKVRAQDIAGNLDATPAEASWTVDTTPPQTTIATPRPTYLNHEAPPPIDFSSNEEGSTFKCSLDDAKEEATTPCSSPYELPEHLELGWHTFVVVATDEAGNTDPTLAKWTFNTGPYPAVKEAKDDKLTSPEEGRKTASYLTLKSEWGKAPEGGGVTSVAYQLKLPSWSAFKYIPSEYLRDAEGSHPAWALQAAKDPGSSEPLFFDAGAYAEAEGWEPVVEGLQLRAVFNGGKEAAGATAPVTTAYTRFAGGPDDATEEIGPATVDLLTGAFTISRTDVSIPVPGPKQTSNSPAPTTPPTAPSKNPTQRRSARCGSPRRRSNPNTKAKPGRNCSFSAATRFLRSTTQNASRKSKNTKKKRKKKKKGSSLDRRMPRRI